MISLEIRFLTGRFAADSLSAPGTPEWPPHPARVYSALTAALHEAEVIPSDERAAMEWLAEAGPPEIIASDMSARSQGDVYVPTNDQKPLPDMDKALLKVLQAELDMAAADDSSRAKAERALKKAEEALRVASGRTTRADGGGSPRNAAELLNRRLKPQPRRFPVAIPHDDVVQLRWDHSPDAQLTQALDRVASRVSRLGHASSLVSMRVLAGTQSVDLAAARWIPRANGGEYLRVPLVGQLELLEQAHRQHQQVEQRLLPADYASYVRVTDSIPQASDGLTPASSWSRSERDWIIFEAIPAGRSQAPKRFNASLAEPVARALRGTILRQFGSEKLPEVISGHDEDGRPTLQPHVAFVPLPFVGHPFATGDVLGVAIVPPAMLSEEDRSVLLEMVHRAETSASESDMAGECKDAPAGTLCLKLGWRGVLPVRRQREASGRSTLKPHRWCQKSRRWYSATPVALGRNPGNLFSRDPVVVARAVARAEEAIAEDCRRSGLPEPRAIWIHKRSLLDGSPAARRFMPYPANGKGHKRVCVHAEILFDEPVHGPLILGAGRFFGVGLFAPVLEDR